jgi:plastocyanin
VDPGYDRGVKGTRLLAFAAVLTASLAAPATISAQETQGNPWDGAGAELQPASPPPAEPQQQTTTAASPEPTPVPEPQTQQGPAVVIRAEAAASPSVSIGDYFYSPRSITVDRGDTVLWTNNGKVPEGHTVTGDGFDSGVLHQGDTYSHEFSSTGTFNYVCTLHPNMKGTVKVGRTSGGETTGGSGASQGSAGAGGESSGGGGGTGERAGFESTESTATRSPGAGGSDGSLPATGLDALLLAIAGVVLVESGLLVRLLVDRPS